MIYLLLAVYHKIAYHFEQYLPGEINTLKPVPIVLKRKNDKDKKVN